jgi:Carbohydrate esterase 2 N-terminal/GDSL-like Lipase/Acylhydrolase family
MGRVGHTGLTAQLYWSGTAVDLNFFGTGVDVDLDDESGRNFYNVLVDGVPVSRLHPQAGAHTYTLVSGLPQGSHNVALYRLTEEVHGTTTFAGFRLAYGGKALVANAPKKRRMEFYGNSITSGYSIEDTAGDSNDPKYFNNYLTFAALTARHCDADYHCICKSGIGVKVGWYPIIMPQLFDRLNPFDSTDKWDFSRFVPDIVVVNLLSNDIMLRHMPDNPNYVAAFGHVAPTDAVFREAYRGFLAQLRGKYPKARIVCTLDAWKDTEKDGYLYHHIIDSAVAEMHDTLIGTCYFYYSKSMPGHPKVRDHELMAARLETYIDSVMHWH